MFFNYFLLISENDSLLQYKAKSRDKMEIKTSSYLKADMFHLGASGLHLTKHENFHGGLDAISVGDGLFTILTTLSKKATSVQVMLQPILTYMACGYMGRQVSFSLLLFGSSER